MGTPNFERLIRGHSDFLILPFPDFKIGLDHLATNASPWLKKTSIQPTSS